MNKVCISIIMIFCYSVPLQSRVLFATVEDVKAYAKAYPEIVAIDNKDYLNPDFSAFYESYASSIWQTIVQAAMFNRKPTVDPDAFLALLHRVTEARKKESYHGKFLRKQDVAQDDHYLVWGNLQGAFHSLALTLEHLKTEKIIDNNFKIIAPKYFMVFNGNAIDRSAYNIETLAIILRLLEVNPTRVFYVWGNHEQTSFWEEFDLNNELQAKIAEKKGLFPPYQHGIIPFSSDINAFFDTLPAALFLTMKMMDKIEAIRIGHVGRGDFQLSYADLSYFLNASDKTVFPLPIVVPQELTGQKQVEVCAMVEGSSSIVPDYTSEGLRLLVADEGTTAWQVLSAPTLTYQKLYNFFMDSYVDIIIGQPLKKTTITQHYQDMRKRGGFKTGRIYNMYSGRSDEQFRNTSTLRSLVVGSSVDLKGPSSSLGNQIKGGLSMAINKHNQESTIPGYLISLVVMDDDGRSTNARSNIESLVQEYKANIMLGLDENTLYNSYLDLVKKYNLLVLFPFTATSKLRATEYPNIVHYAPSYIGEAEVGTQYVLDTVRPDKIAIFYGKNSIGEDALQGAKFVCNQRSCTSIVEVPYSNASSNFSEQVALIKKENPRVIAFFATPDIVQSFVAQMGVHNLAGKVLYGLSALGADSFRKFYKTNGLHFVLTNLVPNPMTSNIPIAEEFRQIALANNVTISAQALEAYIVGSIFIEGLRLIKGPVTRESILHTFESMKNYSYKGLTLTFNKNLRELSSTVWLDTGENKDWVPYTIIKHDSLEYATLNKEAKSNKSEAKVSTTREVETIKKEEDKK